MKDGFLRVINQSGIAQHPGTVIWSVHVDSMGSGCGMGLCFECQCKDHFKLAKSSKVHPASTATSHCDAVVYTCFTRAVLKLGLDLKTWCWIQTQARVLDVALTRDASETKAGRPGRSGRSENGLRGRSTPATKLEEWINIESTQKWQSRRPGSGWTCGSAACLIAALTCQDSREDSTHILVCGQPSFSYDQQRPTKARSVFIRILLLLLLLLLMMLMMMVAMA